MFEFNGINRPATNAEYALDKKLVETEEHNKIVDDHEHVVDIEDPKIKERITEAQKEFADFFHEFGEKMDLGSESSIEEILRAAEERKIYDKARAIRELIFGKNVSLYGVCYLSNECNQNCEFCPIGQAGLEVKKIEAKTIALHELFMKDQATAEQIQEIENLRQQLIKFKDKKIKTVELKDADKEFDSLTEVGHEEICILSGEAISNNISLLMDYVAIAASKPGVKEIILNTGSYSDSQLQAIGKKIEKIKETHPSIKFQFRIFQETYDREAYAEYMKNAPDDKQSKKNFDFRYQAQLRALKSGHFDEVGIGALFGLSKNPLKEIHGLQEHAQLLKEQGGKEPKRCALPFANEPEDIKVRIDYKIPGMQHDKKMTELIYALARLAMPTVSIVSSERDKPETLETLDKYANHSTLFVHSDAGGNMRSLKELAEKKLQKSDVVPQAHTYARHPDDALTSWEERGYNILNFNKEKYDKYRERFPDPMAVWLIENDLVKPRNEMLPDAKPDEKIAWLKKESAFNDELEKKKKDLRLIEHMMNPKLRDRQSDQRKRPFKISALEDNNLDAILQGISSGSLNAILPEVIIIRQDKINYDHALPTNIINSIRETIEKALKKIGCQDQNDAIQPFIAVVCTDEQQQQSYVEQGADVVLQKLNLHGVYNVIQFAAKLKRNSEKLTAEKIAAEFKRFLEDAKKAESGIFRGKEV